MSATPTIVKTRERIECEREESIEPVVISSSCYYHCSLVESSESPLIPVIEC